MTFEDLMVWVKDVSVLYPGPEGYPEKNILALSNISLEIKHAEIVAILGPSGAGKTTLLHVMAGLVDPDVGMVFIDGVSVNLLSGKNLNRFRYERIFIIEQDMRRNLFFELTVGENIELFTLGKSGQVTPTTILKMLDIQQLENIPVARLSGGERQLVCFAIALAMDVKLVILDEPTSALDEKNKHLVMDRITNHCRQRGITLVFTSHDPEIASYANLLIGINYGRFDRVSRLFGYDVDVVERLIAGDHYIVPIDSKGAIHLPEKLRKSLGLEKEAILIPRKTYVEIHPMETRKQEGNAN